MILIGAFIVLGFLLLVQSALSWLVINQVLPFGHHVSFARVFLALLIKLACQYPIGHWHLLSSIGGWIYLEDFVLQLAAVWVVFRLSFWRSLGAAIVCYVITIVVALLYDLAFGYIHLG